MDSYLLEIPRSIYINEYSSLPVYQTRTSIVTTRPFSLPCKLPCKYLQGSENGPVVTIG